MLNCVIKCDCIIVSQFLSHPDLSPSTEMIFRKTLDEFFTHKKPLPSFHKQSSGWNTLCMPFRKNNWMHLFLVKLIQGGMKSWPFALEITLQLCKCADAHCVHKKMCKKDSTTTVHIVHCTAHGKRDLTITVHIERWLCTLKEIFYGQSNFPRNSSPILHSELSGRFHCSTIALFHICSSIAHWKNDDHLNFLLPSFPKHNIKFSINFWIWLLLD